MPFREQRSMGFYRFVRVKDSDVGQVTEAFEVVHTVANDEVVRDRKCDIVCVNFFQPASRFVQAGSDLEGFGLVLQQKLAQKDEGEAGVEDVFDEDDVSAADGGVKILDQSHRAAGFD